VIVKKAPFPPASFLNYDMFHSTFGAPVQLFRAICASVMACSMLYVLGVFRWETHQTQKELDTYRRDMEKNTWLAEVGTMASRMAQKLDEPLAVTKLLLQRVLTDIGETSQNETVVGSLEKSLGEISRATEIVGRFESTAQVLGKVISKPVDLYRLTKRMMAVFAQNAKQANLTISVKDIDEVLNLSITARQLEQVFFIMIQNAIGRSVANRPQKLIISCQVSDNQVEFKFADTCQRIGSGKLQSLFEPFFAEASDDQKIGLELAVAKKIISEYGGDITAESQPGEEPGIIFRVIFPMQSF
jgi:two-component system C4-dicarboxylate transport sensor histidine kinase DctB